MKNNKIITNWLCTTTLTVKMIKLLQEFIYRISKGKTVLILFILTNIVYVFMLVVTIPKVMEFAGGMKLLDMMPAGYDAEYVNRLFSALGAEGRFAYLHNQLPVDMIYPLLFGISYCLLFAWFLRRTKLHESSFFYLCFLPLIAGISDYIENFGIITLLKNFPNYSQETVSITNTFSLLKSTTSTLFFLALIIVMIVFGAQHLKNKKIRFR